VDARRSNRMRICLDTTYLEAVLLHRFVSLLGSIARVGGGDASGKGGNTLSCEVRELLVAQRLWRAESLKAAKIPSLCEPDSRYWRALN
jgi:hypothetical protein